METADRKKRACLFSPVCPDDLIFAFSGSFVFCSTFSPRREIHLKSCAVEQPWRPLCLWLVAISINKHQEQVMKKRQEMTTSIWFSQCRRIAKKSQNKRKKEKKNTKK